MALICLVVLRGIFSIKAIDIDYERLNQKWKMEAVSKIPVKDARSDSDQLRPVLNYDNEIIQIHSFKKKRNWVKVGEGWQLVEEWLILLVIMILYIFSTAEKIYIMKLVFGITNLILRAHFKIT